MKKIEFQCTRWFLFQLMRNQLLFRRAFNIASLKKKKKKDIYIKYLINGSRPLLSISISRHPVLSRRNVLPVQRRQEEADVSRHRQTKRRRGNFKLCSISISEF